MSKPSYAELLKTVEWQNRRTDILERDHYACCRCGSSDHLQVHHRYYISKRLPWHYPDFALITLCDTCHEDEHEPLTFSTWEFVCQDIRPDSDIAPLFAAAFRERCEASGASIEVLMAGLIEALDNPELSDTILELGLKRVAEKEQFQQTL